MPRVTVLLYPEDVPQAKLVGPYYGEVIALSTGETTRVSLLRGPDGSARRTIVVPTTCVQDRRVTAEEVRRGGPGWLLRRPVVVSLEEGRFVYGQRRLDV